MPGDNEAGFVVSTLTPRSAEWARAQDLARHLSGGTSKWHRTPVNKEDAEMRHSHSSVPPEGSLTIHQFVRGDIFVEEGRDTEANHAMANTGSFYSYGLGGSLTVVDPGRGNIYFAYQG